MQFRQHFKSLIRDSSLYLLHNVAAKFAGLFLVPIYTRVFRPEDYGALDIVSNLTWIAAAILLLGLDSSVARYYFETDSPKERSRTASTALFFLGSLSMLSTFLLFVTIPLWGGRFLRSADYLPCLRLAVLTIFPVLLGGFFLNLLKWTMKPRQYVFVSLASLALNLTTAIYLVAIRKSGLIGVFWASLAGYSLMSVLGFLLTRDCFRLDFSSARLGELLHYGLPLVPASIAMTVVLLADRYILMWLTGLHDVGLYAIAIKLSSLTGLFVASFQMAWAPFALSIHQQADAKDVYSRVMTYYSIIASLMMLGLSLFGREILLMFTTREYVDAAPLIPFLCASVALQGAFTIVSIGASIAKKTWCIGQAAVLGAIASVVLSIVLIPFLRSSGAAIASATANAVQAFILYRFSQKCYPIEFTWKPVLCVVVACFLLTAIGISIPSSSLPISIGMKTVLVGLFCVSLFVFPVLGHKKREWTGALAE